MATLHKILSLILGLTFSFNVVAQSRLKIPSELGKEYARKYESELLRADRKCGIVIAPSFFTLYGISLSENCDTLTMIRKSQLRDSVATPAGQLAIDPEFGKSLASLIDTAVDKSTPVYIIGLDGTTYYFYASDGNIASAWTPEKNTNCAVLEELVTDLRKAIANRYPDVIKAKWPGSMDKLATAFINTPPPPPFYFYSKEVEHNGSKMNRYSAQSPLDDPFQINAEILCPAKNPAGGDASGEEDPCKTTFIDFCKDLKIWNEKTGIVYVEAKILVDNDAPEDYGCTHTAGTAKLNFVVPKEKLTAENLKARMSDLIDRYK